MKISKQSRGEPIMEWVCTGPYRMDVSTLYQDNYKVPIEPYEHFWEEAKEKTKLFKESPKEGESLSVFQQEKRWTYVRRNEEEKKLIWASFGTSARMLVTYISNVIIAPESGLYRFRIQYTGSILWRIGEVDVLERRQIGRVESEEICEVFLQKGSNPCMVFFFNVHLHCINDLSLISENEGLQIGVNLEPASEPYRELLEADFDRFYMDKDIWKKEEPIRVRINGRIRQKGKYRFIIQKNPRGLELEETVLWYQDIHTDDFSEEGVTLCLGKELRDCGSSQDRYSIQIDYVQSDGSVIHGCCLYFSFMSFMEEMGEGDYGKRKRFLLQQYGQMQSHDVKDGVYYGLAKLAAGEENIQTEAIEDTIRYINNRYDCADFALHGLIRMYYKYHQTNKLSKDLLEKMKACILGFKYWEDEPGKSMMFTRSENHEILFYSAEYLAGILFPLENFTNSHQNGLFHILKGKMNAERWMKEKGTYGFTEWHSNCYYEEDMLALLNIYDFGEENSYTRTLAKNLLDLICVMVASHSYRGILATTHGRSYERMILHPELEGMSHLNWLMFGQPKKIENHLSIGAVALAGSKYSPHPEVVDIANREEPLYTLSRMGLFAKRGKAGVNSATYRTKEYMVSGLVESQKGEFGHQVHAGQVILDEGIPVFVTCFENKAEHTRPSYWGGQYRVPKTVAYKNVLAYIFQIEDVVGYTHCYFPFDAFDRVEERGQWIVGCKNDAYIALFSLKPYKRVKEGMFKDKELLCMEKKNIWLIEMGSKEQWGSFEEFVSRIEHAKMVGEGEDLIYHSPSVGAMELGWDRVCTVGHQPIIEQDFPLIQNPFCYGEYGKGMSEVYLSGKNYVLSF